MAIALVVADLTGILALVRPIIAPSFSSDLDQLCNAARALTSGGNPYDVVGPGKEFEWAWPVFYPLPAILLVLPFSVIPIHVAHHPQRLRRWHPGLRHGIAMASGVAAAAE